MAQGEDEVSPNFSELRLFNFKSYGEETSVSWKQVSAIVGPNGSGKSTILDAIEYVFCFPRYDKISVKNLKGDICNHDQEKNECTRTWVQVTLKLNGKENIFRREALYDKSSHQYFFNDQAVSMRDYKNHLLEHNVNSQANNFLVEQNAIENIATCGGKDRCLLFERLSDSIRFKEDYNNLKKKLEEANAKMAESKKKFDYLDAQKKKLTKICEQTREYEKLEKKLASKEFKYHFLKFYQIDTSIKTLMDEKEALIEKIDEAKGLEESAENKVEETKEKLKLAEKNLKRIEKESNMKKKTIEECELNLYRVQEALSLSERDLQKVNHRMMKDKEIHEKREKIISELKDEYQEVKRMKKDYESSQSQTISIELQDEQYIKYLELKDEAMRKIAHDIPQLKSLEMELNSLKEEITFIETKKKNLIEDIRKQKSKCDEVDEKESKVRKHLDAVQTDLKQIEEAVGVFNGKNTYLEEKIEDLRAEIERLNQEIGESKFSIGEEKRAQKKRQVLQNLKSHFPGVMDRLKDLIFVSNPDLNVAVTKILGSKAENIVVDSVFTAQKCIRFLKEQYAGDKYSVIETFLPLDLVEPKSSNKIKRILSSEPDLRLYRALDEMGVGLPKLRELLHHHIGDVIICETDEEAMRLSCKHETDCVSFNGTYYRRDGIFSGGLASLMEKSRRWKIDDKHNMQEMRNGLNAELRDLHKKLEKSVERLNEYELKRKGQSEKIQRYLEPLLQELLETKDEHHQKLSELEQKLIKFDDDYELDAKKEFFDEKIAELDELKIRRNAIEDEIFEDFCSSLNSIKNIRQYEQGGFKEQHERKERVKEYEDHLDQICIQIEFEKQRDTENPVENHQKILEKLETKCANLRQKVSELKELIDEKKDDATFDGLQELKNETIQLTKQLKVDNSELKRIQRTISEWSSQITAIDAHVANLRTDKHTLLKNCKINSIEIPLQGGLSVEDVLLRLEAETPTNSENSSPESDESQIKENRIEIDYSDLPENIRTLGEDGFNNYLQGLRKKMEDSRKEIQEVGFDPKAEDNLKTIESKKKESQRELNERVEESRIIKKDFDGVKAQRCQQFNEFFDEVSNNIGQIFKQLYNDDSAQAHVHLKNPEEPYLDGIQYTCLIPKKRCVPMENLSGGEKTISSLAMLLAIYSVKPAPFLIFDEIDAALDNASIRRIRRYFMQSELATQIIIVSHHDLLSSSADALIGISLSPNTNSSHVIHLDLKKYQEEVTESTRLKFSEEARLESLRNRLTGFQ